VTLELLAAALKCADTETEGLIRQAAREAGAVCA
jgi:hypothetical protein